MTDHIATVRPVVQLDNRYWLSVIDCACGEDTPILLDPHHAGPVMAWRAPGHEQLGALPDWIWDRIWPRCGAPTKTTGRPCRNVAGHCHHHPKDT